MRNVLLVGVDFGVVASEVEAQLQAAYPDHEVRVVTGMLSAIEFHENTHVFNPPAD